MIVALQSFPIPTAGYQNHDILFYIEPRLREGQFDTAVICVGINDIFNNTAGTKYPEDTNQMQNVWYQLGFYFKCSAKAQSFK